MKQNKRKIMIALLLSFILLLVLCIAGYTAISPYFTYTGDLGDDVHYLYSAEHGIMILYGKGATWDFMVGEPNGGYRDENWVFSPFRNMDGWLDENTLNTIVILDGITYIHGGLFSNCSGLETVYFPASLTVVEDYAFDNCPGLRTVYFSGNAPSLSIDSFGTDPSFGYGHNPNITVIHQTGTTGYDKRGWGFPEAIIEQDVTIPWLSILFGIS